MSRRLHLSHRPSPPASAQRLLARSGQIHIKRQDSGSLSEVTSPRPPFCAANMRLICRRVVAVVRLMTRGTHSWKGHPCSARIDTQDASRDYMHMHMQQMRFRSLEPCCVEGSNHSWTRSRTKSVKLNMFIFVKWLLLVLNLAQERYVTVARARRSGITFARQAHAVVRGDPFRLLSASASLDHVHPGFVALDRAHAVWRRNRATAAARGIVARISRRRLTLHLHVVAQLALGGGNAFCVGAVADIPRVSCPASGDDALGGSLLSTTAPIGGVPPL